jgi:RecA/RadA recombinase
MPLIQRNKRQEILEQAKEVAEQPAKKFYTPIDVKNRVSTGSTLLDLAISGGRIRGGGIPGGVMMEIFGPSSCGKTALMVEIGASIQDKGGEVDIVDPEARLDKEYARIYGLELPKDHYYRMDLVEEVFDFIKEWEPKNPNVVNMIGADSIAALSTELEMGEGDKRGQKKAKDLHSGCRTSARRISQANKLVVFTNQQLDGEWGPTTSGGKAVGFYSSIRLHMKRKQRVEKEKDFQYENKKVKVKKSVGIESEVTVVKSSVDDDGRTAPVYIMSGIGIDDIRANLQWLKDKTGETTYNCLDGKTYVALDPAVLYIEKHDLESELRERVIDVWEQIETKFKVDRKKKVRF